MIVIFGLYLLISAGSVKQTSFTFTTSKKEQYTLEEPRVVKQRKDNLFSRVTRKFLRSEESDTEVGKWYYVHFVEPLFQEVQQQHHIQLNTKDSLLKNTFVLFLTQKEIEKIENIILIKEILPEEKFHESNGNLSSTNYFYVTGTSDTKLTNQEGLYTIVRKEGNDTYLIQIDSKSSKNANDLLQKKKTVIKQLSELNTVKTITTHTFPKIKNSAMTGYTQQNLQKINDQGGGIYTTSRYVNDELDLNGEGQIVTIQDTPIDFYHSMFYDSNKDVEVNSRMTNHRKFVYYGTTRSSAAEVIQNLGENEHGTHVAGTTAGNVGNNCQNSPNAALYNGNAPAAKILYAGDLNDVSADQLGFLMDAHKSYISTNSWGVDGYVDQVNHMYGSLAYKMQNSLFLFAAGNEYRNGNFTVCDPGGSKNVLTVGAIGDFYSELHLYTVSGGGIRFQALALLDADPWITGTISNSLSSRPRVLVIDGTKGDQCDSVNFGGVSLVYAPSTNDLSWLNSCQPTDTTGVLFTTRSLNDINKLLNSGTVTITDITEINASKPVTHADYSSGGPGNKGILKPDIVTPGTRIISAKSRPNSGKGSGRCRTSGDGDFTFMQGTSMATPNAAGAAVLVRQYFKEKWPKSVDLDGATLRALMINSAKHPHNSKTPDVLFGHGVVDLSTILPHNNNFGVQMTDPTNLPTIASRGILVARVSVSKSSSVKLQITLSYFDPMLEESSAVPITHDLDLVVTSPSAKVFKGDHRPDGDTQHFSTNEKVIIDANEVESGDYFIYVSAENFADSGLSDNKPQKFAVVVSGPITNGEYLSFSKSDSCACLMCTDEEYPRCLCDSDSIGSFCQTKVETADGNKGTFVVEPMSVRRVLFKPSNSIKVIRAKTSGAGTLGRIYFAEKCHVSLSEYDNSVEVGSLMKKETKIDFKGDTICLAISNPNFEQAEYEVEISEKKKNTGMIVGVVVAVVAVVAIGVIVFVLYKKGMLPCGKGRDASTDNA